MRTLIMQEWNMHEWKMRDWNLNVKAAEQFTVAQREVE